ncbi:MAG: hypothetical protein GF398_11735 [Chitinivibrionales bacterium]|nr:hypothetical protein [Chitinivibrionales bacterium]
MLIAALSVATMVVVLGIVIFLLTRVKELAPQRKPHFNPQACIRLKDISRVYKIRANPYRPEQLWFMAREGVRMLDLETLAWTRYGLDHGLMSEWTTDICFADGVPWVATWSGGIAWFDTSQHTFNPVQFSVGFAGARITAIEYVDEYAIYFAIDGHGLYSLQGPGDQPVSVALPGIKKSDRITCLKAVDGKLYIGSEKRKLTVFDPRSGAIEPFLFDERESPETYVWDVLPHKGRLWVATSNDGVWISETQTHRLRRYKDFPAKGAYCFAPERDGFWCGTPFGLWRYHDDGDVWIQFVHPYSKEPTEFQVFALATSERRLWYGSMDLGAGYVTTGRVTWRPLRAGLSRSTVKALIVHDSILWTGYGYEGGYSDRFFAGPVQYDRNFEKHDGLRDSHIQVFARMGETFGYGAYNGFGIWDSAAYAFQHFDQSNGLPHGDIAGIEAVNDTLILLASQFGIISFNPIQKEFRTISQTEKYRITDVHFAESHIWFGTLGRGLIRFNSAEQICDRFLLAGADRIMGIAPSGHGGELYVATRQSGCYLLSVNSARIRKLPIPDSIPLNDAAFDAHIKAVREIDGRIWIGTRNRGCFIYLPSDGTWRRLTYYEGLISDEVLSFYDTDSHVWIGCYGGVCKYDKEYINTLFGK